MQHVEADFRKIRFNLPSLPLALLGLLPVVSMILNLGIVGQIVLERSRVVESGIADALVIAAAGLALLIRLLIRRSVLRVPREHVGALALVVAWFLVTGFAVLRGSLLENDFGYLAGDSFKFLRFGGILLIAYFSISSPSGIYSLLLLLMTVWIGFVLIELAQFGGILAEGQRLVSYPTLASSAFTIFALHILNHRTSYTARLVATISLALGLLSPILSQSRGLLATTIFAIGIHILLTLLDLRARRILPRILLLLCGLGVLVLITTGTYFKASSASFAKRIGDIEGGSLPAALRESGARFLEAQVIVEMLVNEPMALILGFGMGSEYSIDTSAEHFLHSGIVEVVFRTGLPGLLLFISLLVYFVWFSGIHFGHHPYFSLALVYALTVLFSTTSLIGNSLLDPFFPGLIFAGALRATSHLSRLPHRV